MSDEELLQFNMELKDIILDKTSSSGTAYSALVLPNGEWVFAWEGIWKDMIDEHTDLLKHFEVEIYAVDKEEDPDDHFYNLKALTFTDPVIAGRLLEKISGDFEPTHSEEERKELLSEVDQAFS